MLETESPLSLKIIVSGIPEKAVEFKDTSLSSTSWMNGIDECVIVTNEVGQQFRIDLCTTKTLNPYSIFRLNSNLNER